MGRTAKIRRRAMLSGLLLVLVPLVAKAQNAADTTNVDPAIAAMAGQLVEKLGQVKAKTVLILDLRGPQHEKHPAGKWLADQIAVALRAKSQELKVLDRSQVSDEPEGDDQSANELALVTHNALAQARKVGAAAVVTGTFAKISAELGVTLNPLVVEPPRTPITPVYGSVGITSEVSALSSEPIPTFKGSAPRAGLAGLSTPKCIYCPAPSYTDEARRAHLSGSVTLDVLVTTSGAIENAIVIKGPGLGLEQKALDSVKKWKLAPATANGKPIASRVVIEVAFRIMRD